MMTFMNILDDEEFFYSNAIGPYSPCAAVFTL